MSLSLSEPAELDCPNCGHTFEAVVWRIVDADERPDLRLLILLGRLNWVSCPHCGTEALVPAPLLYHDARHQAVLLALPASETLQEHQVRAQVDPLIAALHGAIPPERRQAYLYNVQLAGSMAGLAAEIRSWGGIELQGGG